MVKNSKPLVVVPEPPGHLSERSRRLWLEVVPTRVRSAARLAQFQTALEALDRADQTSARIGGDLTITTPRSGCEHLNPLLKVEKENRQLFIKIMAQLGLHRDPINPFPYGSSNFGDED